jgi:hypothetical protein
MKHINLNGSGELSLLHIKLIESLIEIIDPSKKEELGKLILMIVSSKYLEEIIDNLPDEKKQKESINRYAIIEKDVIDVFKTNYVLYITVDEINSIVKSEAEFVVPISFIILIAIYHFENGEYQFTNNEYLIDALEKFRNSDNNDNSSKFESIFTSFTPSDLKEIIEEFYLKHLD